ncbi:MAG: methylenetetrahydrofolate reductase [NAD(P)H] [Chloroflexi bacterium]|nr:methylenetetrahydrofolate reductase [NAD(P)H] [Chloroflexota bacterium]
MKIPDLLTAKQTLSFEFFPPKHQSNLADVLSVIEDFKVLNPDFISITFGAGGSTVGKSEDLAIKAQKDIGLNVMSHLTITNQSVEQIDKFLNHVAQEGVQNILALRGDLPQMTGASSEKRGAFQYARELIQHIVTHLDVAIGAACYPEGHPESPDLEADIAHTKNKVDAGAQFLVTQLFFDNNDYYRFLERASRAGISVPVVAGIMPILDASQARRFAARCGAKIPPKLNEGLEKYGYDSAAVQEFGVEYTTTQLQDLWTNNVPGVHFYTLNRTYSVTKVLRNLNLAD